MGEVDTDPKMWVSSPDPVFHGLRVVDHDGTAFIETVDDTGEVHVSIMLDTDEVSGLIQALQRVERRHV